MKTKMLKRQVRDLRVEHLAPNQSIITAEGNQVLQSYESTVAVKYADGSVELGQDWEHSRTTMKYVGQFLDSNAANTRKQIKNGAWKLNTEL